MKITEIRIGMVLDLGCRRRFEFASSGMVEGIGVDWVVVRVRGKHLELLDIEVLKSIEEYVEPHEDENG